MTSQRATDTNQELRNIPAKVRYEKTRHIENVRWRAALLLGSRLSIEALDDRAVDGEASTLKFSPIWPSDQAVLHEGENLELFTYLSPEPLVDCILSPFEQLCIPIGAVIERDGWDSA